MLFICNGMIFPPVFISRSSKAAKVKLADGPRVTTGVDEFLGVEIGAVGLKAKDGVRGRHIPSPTAILKTQRSVK